MKKIPSVNLNTEALVNVIQPGFKLYSRTAVIDRLSQIAELNKPFAYSALVNIDFEFLIWALINYSTDPLVMELLESIFNEISAAYEVKNLFIKKIVT